MEEEEEKEGKWEEEGGDVGSIFFWLSLFSLDLSSLLLLLACFNLTK